MARKRRKIKTSIVIIIFTLVSLTYLGFIGVSIYKKYNLLTTLTTDNNKLNKQLADKNENKNTTTLEKEKILEEIDYYKNIDTKIQETKTNVFKLASELENKIQEKNSNYKIAYITFDDGPYYSTNKVLEILKKYRVKATFFTIGYDKDKCFDQRSASCYDTYKKEVLDGHTIANHTYTHAIFNGLYSSASNFLNDVKKQEELIQNRTGVKTNIVRFPGGSSTAGRLKNSIISGLREMGYGWVDWTAEDGDGGYVSGTSSAFNKLKNTIDEDIEVVLFHDYCQETISILPQAIEYLESNNYILLPLFYDSIKVNK